MTRFLAYVLGRRPYEFGLVPDQHGFVHVKELLQAIHEETGWAYVRRSHISEVLLGAGRDLFESEEDKIRARKRHWRMGEEATTSAIPKLLYTAVRERAHPVVLEKGIHAPKDRYVVLSPKRDMVRKMGLRRGPSPVLIEVLASSAHTEGIPVLLFGELFLAPHIPARFIAGPPVPKNLQEKLQKQKSTQKEEKNRFGDPTPGSFLVDMDRDVHPKRPAKGRKPKGWKEAARKTRKDKRN